MNCDTPNSVPFRARNTTGSNGAGGEIDGIVVKEECFYVILDREGNICSGISGSDDGIGRIPGNFGSVNRIYRVPGKVDDAIAFAQCDVARRRGRGKRAGHAFRNGFTNASVPDTARGAGSGNGILGQNDRSAVNIMIEEKSTYSGHSVSNGI